MIRICNGSCLPKTGKIHILPPSQLPSCSHQENNSGQEMRRQQKTDCWAKMYSCTCLQILNLCPDHIRSPQIHVKQAYEVSFINLLPSIMQTAGINGGNWRLVPGMQNNSAFMLKMGSLPTSSIHRLYEPTVTSHHCPWSGDISQNLLFSVPEEAYKWYLPSHNGTTALLLLPSKRWESTKQVKICCTGKLNKSYHGWKYFFSLTLSTNFYVHLSEKRG